MEYKSIYFNQDRSIKKDFTNRNIAQHSHNVECMNLYLPKTIFTNEADQENSVRVAFTLANDDIVNDKYCNLNLTFVDDEYYMYQCLLSSGYTASEGLLKMSIRLNTVSTVDSEVLVTNVWASNEFKLNVMKTSSSTFELEQSFETALAEQLETQINANAQETLGINTKGPIYANITQELNEEQKATARSNIGVTHIVETINGTLEALASKDILLDLEDSKINSKVDTMETDVNYLKNNLLTVDDVEELDATLNTLLNVDTSAETYFIDKEQLPIEITEFNNNNIINCKGVHTSKVELKNTILNSANIDTSDYDDNFDNIHILASSGTYGIVIEDGDYHKLLIYSAGTVISNRTLDISTLDSNGEFVQLLHLTETENGVEISENCEYTALGLMNVLMGGEQVYKIDGVDIETPPDSWEVSYDTTTFQETLSAEMLDLMNDLIATNGESIETLETSAESLDSRITTLEESNEINEASIEVLENNTLKKIYENVDYIAMPDWTGMYMLLSKTTSLTDNIVYFCNGDNTTLKSITGKMSIIFCVNGGTLRIDGEEDLLTVEEDLFKINNNAGKNKLTLIRLV